MTSKTILVLAITAAFVAGTIVASTTVFAQEDPPRREAFAAPQSDFFEKNYATAQEIPSDIKEGIISVTGTANTSVEPDLLVITFGVETQETTAKLALDTNSQTMSNIITAIMSTGIMKDEISTSKFNIYPIYEGYEDPITKRWKQELTGYRVTNTIAVETPNLTMAADVIDGAVNSGANKVESVSFKLSPEKYLQLKDELIETAILNAKFKAENALAPLDYSITGVKAVSLSEFGAPPPIPFYESAFDGSLTAKSASTPIFSSDQDVSTTASVIFTIGRI